MTRFEAYALGEVGLCERPRGAFMLAIRFQAPEAGGPIFDGGRAGRTGAPFQPERLLR